MAGPNPGSRGYIAIMLFAGLEHAPTALAAVGLYVTLVWLLSLARRDSGIMDVFWGPGFLLVSGLVAWLGGAGGGRTLAVLLLVGLWAIRLAVHIGVRNHGKPEDARYARWRAEAGPKWWWFSWFKVFALQGVILWFVSFPLQVLVLADPAGFPGVLEVIGMVLFVVGLVLESMADAQLAAFRRAGTGGVMDRGLWRYSRHPNYFGECVIWLGVAVWVLAVPGGWMTLPGPVLMIWLVIRVSGVRMLDDLLAETKPGYAEYMARTSAFVPLPLRQTAD
jgi:steroid 5-alpha reductase family enzyme